MKTNLLIITALLFSVCGFAQKSKTIEMTSAGNIISMFSQNELDSVNNLTIIGQINYQDLKYLDNQMDRLDTLNLLHAEIVEYVQHISAWENKYFYANSIHASTFYQNQTLKRVILPANLLRIEEFAFYNCPHLNSVVLSATVTQIYKSAFENCTSLLQIDPEIPDKLDVLGSKILHNSAWLAAKEMGAVYIKDVLYAWKGEMASDTELTLKDSIRLVLDSAFQGVQNLIALTIPATTGNLGNGAFANCLNLKSIKFQGPVQMGTGVFTGCNNIQNLNVNSTIQFLTKLQEQEILTKVQQLVLSGEVNAVDFKVIRDQMPALSALNLKDVDIQAYYGSEGTIAQTKSYPYRELPDNALYAGWPAPDNAVLKMLILPDSLRSIGNLACSSLIEIENVLIPSKVSDIKTYAFYNCQKLTGINLPEGLKNIRSAAFVTTNITDFSLPASLEQLSGSAFNNTPWYNAQPDGLVYLRNDIAYRLKGELPLGTKLEVRSGTTILAGSVFSGMASESIAAVDLPNSLLTIGENAFSMCTELTSLKLPGELSYIGASCFDGCTKLGTLNLPASLKFMGDMAFYNCSGLDSLFVFTANPLQVESTTFWNANNSNCVLYVPQGAVNAYSSWAALGWNTFAKIREMPDWVLSSTPVVYAQKDQIFVRGSHNAHISVYHLNGMRVFESAGSNADIRTFPVFQKGIYIVRVDAKSYKIMVD